MPLHDFRCKPCDVVFEDVSAYNRALGGVEPVACPECGEPCGIIWLKAPGVHGDENLTAEQKVAVALKLGFGQDGRLTIPQTRTDLKKIREVHGDIKVGEKEILTADKKAGYQRMTEPEKRKVIEGIRKRRAQRRAGEIPKAAPDSEVISVQRSTPLSETRILTKKDV